MTVITHDEVESIVIEILDFLTPEDFMHLKFGMNQEEINAFVDSWIQHELFRKKVLEEDSIFVRNQQMELEAQAKAQGDHYGI